MTPRNVPEVSAETVIESAPVGNPWDVTPEAPSFDATDDWAEAGETWRFDLRAGDVNATANDLWDVPREFVMEIVVDDPPTIGVRIAYVEADTSPAQQDWCGATLAPPFGDLHDDVFTIDVDPQVDLGHHWAWQDVQITGRMDRETGLLTESWWGGAVDATSMAIALGYGEDDDICDALATQNMPCVPCAANPSDACVFVKIPMTGGREPGFILEPMNQADVEANPHCITTGPR